MESRARARLCVCVCVGMRDNINKIVNKVSTCDGLEHTKKERDEFARV